MFFVLLLTVMSLSDWGVHQFGWWPTNYNEVEISFGEVQSLCEGTETLCVKRVSITSKSCVQIMLYCHIDTTFHEDEVWYQSDSSELLTGWPRGSETAPVFPAAALNAAHIDWAKKAKVLQLGVSLVLWYCSEERCVYWKTIFRLFF